MNQILCMGLAKDVINNDEFGLGNIKFNQHNQIINTIEVIKPETNILETDISADFIKKEDRENDDINIQSKLNIVKQELEKVPITVQLNDLIRIKERRLKFQETQKKKNISNKESQNKIENKSIFSNLKLQREKKIEIEKHMNVYKKP